MVGVPGRSKRCRTCEQRHIACDLQHLTQVACGPCAKSKRVCQSRQKHIFVNHDEGSHKTVYRKADGKRDHPGGHIWQVQLEMSQSASDSPSIKPSSASSAPTTLMPQSIPDTALIKQQFLANATLTMSSGRQGDSEFPRFWSSAITSQSLDSWACRTSPALACYTAWLGRESNDPNLIYASRKLYVQGLKEVQQSVNDANIALLDETLSACIGLVVYEALECPDHSYAAYNKHIDGCSALIKLRGVDAHRDGVGNELFRGFRYIAIIKALQDHKSTYLTDPAWSDVPFSHRPKDAHDKLLDVLAKGASFLGESDRFATIPPTNILLPLLSMNERLIDLNSQLEALYVELATMHNGRLYWPTSPSVTSIDDTRSDHSGGDDLQTPISFPDQETARLLTLYWAQQTLLRMGRAELHQGLAGLAAAGMVEGQAERVNHSLSQPPKLLIESAHLVLRARDYCSRSQSTLLRFSVPLNITLDVLAIKPELYAEEIAFAKDIKRQISQRHLRITQYTSTLKHVRDV